MRTLIAFCVLACATAAIAHTPPVTAAGDQLSGPPAPPEGASEEQLRAWIQRYIDRGSYVEAAVDANRVILIDPASVELLPDGHVVAWVRSELFRPRVVDGFALRSIRKKLEIDCGEWRYKELAIEGYAASNLQQPISGLPMADTWTKPLADTSSAGIPLRKACGYAKDHH